MEKASILVVDDELRQRKAIKAILKGKYNFDEAEDGETAIAKLGANNYNLILTDMRMPKKDGLEVIKAAKEHSPLTPVIVLTAVGTIENAVESIKVGAIDYIQLENMEKELEVKVKKALEHQQLAIECRGLRRQVEEFQQGYRLIGESDELKSVLKKIQKVGDSDCTVLITGESGTGKECVARAIHVASQRRNSPFFAFNCAAIPEEMAESELFGHEKGAFTGAVERRIGYFELANRGTLFLDEVGEMSMKIQPKLLRVLREKSFMCLGGTCQIQVDVRIIAATNKNLWEAVRAGEFREDLYYRFVFPIHVPPLRDRKSDILLLANYFLGEVFKSKKTFSGRALKALQEYPWPGNVGELRNYIERAKILCDEETIEPEHLFETHKDPLSDDFHSLMKKIVDCGEYSKEDPLIPKVEIDLVKRMTERADTRREAADLLGIREPTLRDWLKKSRQ